MKPAAVLAVLLLAACTSTSTAARPSPTPTASASAPASPSTELPTPSPTPSPSPTEGSPSATPSASSAPIDAPTVSCRASSSATAMVMIGGYYGATHLIYDVTDPLHPHLVCTIYGTAAHLVNGDTFAYLKPLSQSETDVILHSIGSGSETQAASFPVNITDPGLAAIWDEAWQPDGSLLAYRVADETNYTVNVYLYSGGKTSVVHTYGLGIGDCMCRFGISQPVLAFSPDGQYLVDGQVAGKGATPITVIRVSDRTVVYTADITVTNAVWNRTGHQLFLMGNGMQTWTPESGGLVMQGSTWSFLPGLSPDGSTATYTAYTDPDTQLQPRVYDYDLKSQQTHLLVDKMRTQALFVKNGWVWYLEERPCTSNDQCLGGTIPTGNVFAMQLATGAEEPVTFAAGENPSGLSGGMGWALNVFTPGEFWPAA